MPTLYALHYGTPRNQFYGFYAKPPKVQRRKVLDETTRKIATLYESPDKLELNLCVSGFERIFDVEVPLGQVVEVTFTVKKPAPFTCQFCGSPSWVDPSDQSMPPSYCHDSDHGSEEDAS